jgi:hypothetical protein
MFRFTIRDVLWLMLLVAIFAGLYWQRTHQPAPPAVETKTVEVTINPDGTSTTRTSTDNRP